MSTPLEDLRTALATIDRESADATPGPWRSQGFDHYPGDEGTPILGGGEAGLMHEHLIAYTLSLGVTKGKSHVYDEAKCDADAALIVNAVSLYRGVVRDIIKDAIADVDDYTGDPDALDDIPTYYGEALRLAKAINARTEGAADE